MLTITATLSSWLDINNDSTLLWRWSWSLRVPEVRITSLSLRHFTVRVHVLYASLVPATRSLCESATNPLSAMERRRRRTAETAAERESDLYLIGPSSGRRAAETDEERYERLCRQRERRRESRAAETAEQRQLRLQRDRERRQAQTADEIEARLQRDRDRRQAQTADERDAIQQRRRERRATETAEQRQVRLQRDHERRQGQTADEREAIQRRRIGREELQKTLTHTSGQCHIAARAQARPHNAVIVAWGGAIVRHCNCGLIPLTVGS